MIHHFKIEICGLYYHSSDLFLFHGFYSVIPIPLKFQIFIHVYVLFINPVNGVVLLIMKVVENSVICVLHSNAVNVLVQQIKLQCACRVSQCELGFTLLVLLIAVKFSARIVVIRYCIVENFGEYAWIYQNFTRLFSKHRKCSRCCSSVSECCYSGEWLVFRKYPIKYSMVLD